MSEQRTIQTVSRAFDVIVCELETLGSTEPWACFVEAAARQGQACVRLWVESIEKKRLAAEIERRLEKEP